MNAQAIVDILIEGDAEEFVSSLPSETWDSFHIIHDQEDNVHAGEGYRQHELVYKNNGDGTRDFIGYLVQASNMKYYPAGVARPQPGSQTRVDKLDWQLMKPYGSENRVDAARHLMAIYNERNR